ncbi:MAG: response regulator transcription factor [Ignavibacteria bacterium]|nr:response regulator transcription factor [Ignavibacteria bacterium]
MNSIIKLVIADDHPLLREGLVQILQKQSNFKVMGEASNGEEAIKLIKEKQPDIAILDVQMPVLDGFEVAKTVLRDFPKTKIIFLTMYKEERLIKKVFELGIKGYVLKESAVNDIVNSINDVSNDKFYLSPQVSHILLKSISQSNGKNELTQSEQAIINLIGKGKSSQEIADELFISPKTVRNHRSNIYKKLYVNSKAEVITKSMRGEI